MHTASASLRAPGYSPRARAVEALRAGLVGLAVLIVLVLPVAFHALAPLADAAVFLAVGVGAVGLAIIVVVL